MGQPSTQASNAIIYLSYGAFLYAAADFYYERARWLVLSVFGCFVAWKLRHQSKVFPMHEHHYRVLSGGWFWPLIRVTISPQTGLKLVRTLNHISPNSASGLQKLWAQRMQSSTWDMYMCWFVKSVASGPELHCVWLVILTRLKQTGIKMRQSMKIPTQQTHSR